MKCHELVDREGLSECGEKGVEGHGWVHKHEPWIVNMVDQGRT